MNKPEFLSGSQAMKPPFQARYGNFINGKFTDPVNGRYFENLGIRDENLKFAAS